MMGGFATCCGTLLLPLQALVQSCQFPVQVQLPQTTRSCCLTVYALLWWQKALKPLRLLLCYCPSGLGL